MHSKLGWLVWMIALSGSFSFPSQAEDTPKYWVFFVDKGEEASVGERPFVTERALRRRALRGSTSGRWLDRPLSPKYVSELEKLGVEVIVSSRWLNAVSARLSPRRRLDIERLPFVQSVQPVASWNRGQPPGSDDVRIPLTHDAAKARRIDYGASETQLSIINAVDLLEQGINGAGVRIGFLDTPFGDFDHPAFQELIASSRLIAVRDFVQQPQAQVTHGLSVASVAVGFDPGQLVGPAYGAEVLAATTEYGPTETNQEEDFFVAGLEWLESMGADVVNVSLGYTTFDQGQRSYTAGDLDGDTGVTTRAADRAAQLGVVMVVSAGNEGGCPSPAPGCWYYIGTPADGDSVIAVGAIRPDSSRASFSSFGPTADGRIKPDVAAPGSSVYVATPTGYGFSGGTSFASPIVAGVVCQMLQVNPDLGPIDVLNILRATAHQAGTPDNSLGWGIINAAAAVQTALGTGRHDDEPLPTHAYPNPATDVVFIHINATPEGPVEISVHDLLGRRVLHTVNQPGGGSVRLIRLETDRLASGVYLYTAVQDGKQTEGKFVVAR